MATKTKKERPSVLAFSRKLDPSDALLFAGKWNERNASQNWPAITLKEKSVRGTISHHFSAKNADPAKLNASTEKANLQTVDVATLPADADTLKVRFTLRVHGNVGKPCTCNDAAYGAELAKNIEKYVQTNGFSELARRYALNLANGRFLWRNRIGAEQVEVHVEQLKDGEPAATWIFNALDISLRDMDARKEQSKKIPELAEIIASGLKKMEGNPHVLLRITAFSRIGDGQEVFPSQELILDRKPKKNKQKENENENKEENEEENESENKERGRKSRTLYDVDGVAAIHSQKIGNAIRTIDTWYAGAEENGPIAVEPYGSVTTQGKSWRWQKEGEGQPSQKQDFYSLLDDWIAKDKTPDQNQQHYVVATLIRGGVFGKGEK